MSTLTAMLKASVIRRKIARLWELSYKNHIRVYAHAKVKDLDGLLTELWALEKELQGYAKAGIFDPPWFITSLDSEASQLAFDSANAGKRGTTPPRPPRKLAELRIKIPARGQIEREYGSLEQAREHGVTMPGEDGGHTPWAEKAPRKKAKPRKPAAARPRARRREHEAIDADEIIRRALAKLR